MNNSYPALGRLRENVKEASDQIAKANRQVRALSVVSSPGDGIVCAAIAQSAIDAALVALNDAEKDVYRVLAQEVKAHGE